MVSGTYVTVGWLRPDDAVGNDETAGLGPALVSTGVQMFQYRLDLKKGRQF